MRAALRVLYAVARAVVWPFVRVRAARLDGARAGERFGVVPTGVPRGVIWIHAVSAGETIAVARLVRDLARRFPHRPLLVTTTTRTGSAQVARLLGDVAHHAYAPYDFDRAVVRFLRATQPRALVLFETELWPNLLRRARQSGTRIALVNARLSERSARGYRLIAPLTREMLDALDWIGCQYDAHRARFLALGARTEKLESVGSVKWDVDVGDDLAARALALRGHLALGDAPVWVAGSTHAGEESLLLDAFARLQEEFTELRLLLVPRHPERFDDVVRLAAVRGFRVARRSESRPDPGARVVVGDSMGELPVYYALGRVAFVGGSLVSSGGHNPIEAALAGVPMLIGPHDFNFADVVARFQDAGVLARVHSVDDLVAAVSARLVDAAVSVWEVGTARRVVLENRGASERVLDRLSQLIERD